LFVLGQQGRGKGRTGFEISKYRHPDNITTLGFFGTAHFANEFFSLVDGARLHLVAQIGCDPSEPHRTSVERFFDALGAVQADCFFVFGGMERLLRNLPYHLPEQSEESAADVHLGHASEEPTGIDPDIIRMLMQFRWGRSASLEISQFLDGVLQFGRETAEGRQPSGSSPEVGFYKCIFLTSSVLPNALQQDIKNRHKNKETPDHGPVSIRSLVPCPVTHSIDDTLSGAGESDPKDLQAKLAEVRSFVPQDLYPADVLHHVVKFALTAESGDASRSLAWLGDLALDLGRTESRARPEEVIRSAVAFLSSGNIIGDPPKFGTSLIDIPACHRRWTRLAMVLETLSLFTTPVETYVLAAALETSPIDPYVNAAIREGKESKESQWTAADWQEGLPGFLKEIYCKTRLVLRIEAVPEGGREFRYTAHSLVRSAMLRRLGGRPNRPAEIQQFDLNDFASEPADVQPLRVEGAERTLRAFDALVVEADMAYAPINDSGAPATTNKAKLRAFIRGAYGILRAGWSATGLGRLLTEAPSVGSPAPVYQQYHRRLTRLLNLVHAYDGLLASPPASVIPVSTGPTEPSDHDGALYHDELAWLFNELGLVCYCQGALPDSSTFFQLGERVNRRIESGEPNYTAGAGKTAMQDHSGRPGYRQIESKINLASVLIDRARLSRARDALTQAATYTRECQGDADSIKDEIMARIHGFLGLVAHLSGDSRKALALYGSAIDVLSRYESWRGVSVFSRHRSDLHRAENRFKKAHADLATAIAAAEEGFHPDLVHYCRISEANLTRIETATQAPNRILVTSLEPTLRFARNIGSAKLESDVYRVMGLIELDQRDFEAATRSALNCLWLASAYHLRLRLMSSLELLGRLLRERGDLSGARKVFESVVRLGQSFEYQRPAEYADKALAELTLRQR
jgi:tetratricopeptide (TPR) repeat protein